MQVMVGGLTVAPPQALAGTPAPPQQPPLRPHDYAPPQPCPYLQPSNQPLPQPQPQQQLQPRLPAAPAVMAPTLQATSRGAMEEVQRRSNAKVMQGFVLLYVRSLSQGASAAEVFLHCTTAGLQGDAVTVQCALDTLVDEMQLYRNQQGLYAAL